MAADVASLAYLASTLRKGARILEIGAWAGRSTLALLAGAGEGKTVDSVDSWSEKEFAPAFYGITAEVIKESFYRATKPYVVAGRLRVFEGDYREVLPGLDRAAYDMVFVDGPHDVEHAEPTISLIRPLMKQSGVVVFHDADPCWPGVRKMIDLLESDGGWTRGPTAGRMVFCNREL